MKYNFCPKCGRQLKDIFRFCPECGLNLGSTESSVEEKLSVEKTMELYNGRKFEQAFPHILRHAKNGNAACQAAAGYYYDAALIGEEDLLKAVHWYEKSARQGHFLGQFYLAESYYRSRGVSQDLSKALHWYTESARQGFAEAQNMLATCYAGGWGAKTDMQKAAHWFEQAAMKGHVEAQFNLGVCYYNGTGVEQDLQKAVQWLYNSARQGNEKAVAALKQIGVIGID